MKSIIRRVLKESEHLKGLFSELPPFLRRRLTMEDLEWLDQELTHHIVSNGPTNKFDDFCDYVLGDLLHEFLVNRKDDEIDTVNNPVYGLIYDEDSLGKIGDIYFSLKPYLKKRYEMRLRQAWNVKKRQVT